MTRAIGFFVHNWPLKLAAIGLASLLYGGVVLSRDNRSVTVSVPIEGINAPSDVIVLSNLGAVTSVNFVASPDIGFQIGSSTFRATVDLAGVEPTGNPISLKVTVTAIVEGIQVLDFDPQQIVLTIDRVATKSVPIHAIAGPVPSGLDAGEPIVEGATAIVRGPQSVVNKVTEVQARVSIDASGIDVNQLVDLLPVDSTGEPLAPIDVEPAQARVRVPVFTDRRSKSLPVTPTVVGSPAAGFEVASIDVRPPVASIEGDANDLAGLDRADTLPISVSGASSTITQVVGLDLPDGVQALGSGTVAVTITLRPITGTRTFEAGLVLVGARPNLVYSLSTDHVLVTIGGSIADLDRLSGATIVLNVDVTGLDPGTHSVAVSANLATGTSLVGASPNPIDVTVSTAAAPESSPGSSPAP